MVKILKSRDDLYPLFLQHSQNLNYLSQQYWKYQNLKFCIKFKEGGLWQTMSQMKIIKAYSYYHFCFFIFIFMEIPSLRILLNNTSYSHYGLFKFYLKIFISFAASYYLLFLLFISLTNYYINVNSISLIAQDLQSYSLSFSELSSILSYSYLQSL